MFQGMIEQDHKAIACGGVPAINSFWQLTICIFLRHASNCMFRDHMNPNRKIHGKVAIYIILENNGIQLFGWMTTIRLKRVLKGKKKKNEI